MVVGTSSVAARSSSNVSRVAITPKQLAERVSSAKGSIALVFGRESSGLTNQELDSCDFMVTIPASHDYNVLNVATAASIMFYEIFHRTKARQDELASEASKQRLLIQFDRLTRKCEMQSHRRRLAQRALRNEFAFVYLKVRGIPARWCLQEGCFKTGLNLSNPLNIHARTLEQMRHEGQKL